MLMNYIEQHHTNKLKVTGGYKIASLGFL